MPYDEHFRDFDPVNKVRLVIFEDIAMAKAYAECDVSYHEERFKSLGAADINVTPDLLNERKHKFEDSARGNDGRLFFTTLNHLPLIFPPSARLEPFTAESCLEFAYADDEEVPGHRLILESGFTSEFSRRQATGAKHDKTALQFRHVTFYVEPGTDCAICINAMKLYKDLYGHLNDLRVIATTLFSTLKPDWKIFVTSDNISKLSEGTP